ncbi:phage protein Gp37 [Megalodesulfovibrio gigas]|uniref:Uncharacterized protein n=1 Tax=Megalodesulfovibrio gigas (strain ATCC 19364 / DSM 1382 / NCIMB 9332 / VKM B-1759) TaxID=1121448 RepID=T2GCW3_MEGG1|nr:phage protein Gp37 [Megalodesulfovibrio gigas]AGW14123.1 hypothetical protein DGI_2371 [Megalodesulfovibrio gigas DSM 1382 = ATCC 19364]
MQRLSYAPAHSIRDIETAIVRTLLALQLPGVQVEPYRFQFDQAQLPTLRQRLPAYLVAWNESRPLALENRRHAERLHFAVICGDKSFRRDVAAEGGVSGPGVYALVEAARDAMHAQVVLPGLKPCVVERAYGASYANGIAICIVDVTLDQVRVHNHS